MIQLVANGRHAESKSYDLAGRLLTVMARITWIKGVAMLLLRHDGRVMKPGTEVKEEKRV